MPPPCWPTGSTCASTSRRSTTWRTGPTEVVASFISHRDRERIRARAQIPADDATIDSLYPLYPGTDYLEREVYDLMGITFADHPDHSRILMPETWDGHPLRKDYAIGAIPVQFKATAN